MISEGQLIILAICAIGMSWRAYSLGIRAGIDRYIDYCKDISRKHNGRILIQFHGNDIHFLDPLTYDKIVLDAIAKAATKDDDSS
jgi:hypothetical protein|tara:strand:+ start:395 stop:649 length:255 start_codon:yes stop_codon:yes gene_type:complete